MVTNIINFLRLIRWPNLLIIILTQVLLQYCIIVPILNIDFEKPSLSPFHFSLLVLSTVLIAAAGNIINDYFDVKADAINKPDKVFIGRTIRKKSAFTIYLIFNALAFFIASYLAWKIHNIKLVIIHLVVIGLLWFYSSSYKKQFLIGNIVIAGLSAFVILIVGFYEPILYVNVLPYIERAVKAIMFILIVFAAFAFLVSLMREIVKDMEDVEGDSMDNCRTLPIVAGIPAAKIIVVFITVILLLVLAYLEYLQIQKASFIGFFYIFLGIQFPLLIFLTLLVKANQPKDYHYASNLLKVIMLAGIGSLYLFYYLLIH